MNEREEPDFARLLLQLTWLFMVTAAHWDDTPIGRITHECFENNWTNCRDGLLTRTSLFRVYPLLPMPAHLPVRARPAR